MSLPAKLLIALAALGLAWALGFRMGSELVQGRWDAAKAETLSQVRNAERKGIEFNHAAAVARAASAAIANQAAQQRAERVNRATMPAAPDCRLPDGVRNDLSAAIDAANAAR